MYKAESLLQYYQYLNFITKILQKTTIHIKYRQLKIIPRNIRFYIIFLPDGYQFLPSLVFNTNIHVYNCCQIERYFKNLLFNCVNESVR